VVKEATWTEPSARESKRNQGERKEKHVRVHVQRKTGDDHVITAAAVDRAGGRHGAEVFGAVGPMLKWALIVVMVVGQAAVSAALKSVSLRFSPGSLTESRSGKGH
jgi:hypothetical protein